MTATTPPSPAPAQDSRLRDVIRAETSRATIALSIIGVVAIVLGTLDSLPDAAGDRIGGSADIVVPSIIAVWACVEVAWRRSRFPLPPRILVRAIVIPVPIVLVATVVAGLVSSLPFAQQTIAEAQTAAGGFHYWWGDATGWAVMPLVLFGGWGVAGFMGLMTLLIVTIPLIAVRNTRRFAIQNGLDDAPDVRRRNGRAALAAALGLSAATIATILLVADVAWPLGIVVLVAAVGLFVLAAITVSRRTG
ncbi:MAG: hypothetical protein ABW040_07790 [Microbacteriaceae bacterium]